MAADVVQEGQASDMNGKIKGALATAAHTEEWNCKIEGSLREDDVDARWMFVDLWFSRSELARQGKVEWLVQLTANKKWDDGNAQFPQS